ncbi:TIGR04211 family SH3 domain-containing protein [Arcobacter sp. LA11]|uniref:TIGR04211 family SH3 domain-containing protein n=1 Tax=Arcobacter sp. LA11 TaxID=1898176 RepID=UPI000934598A|nr:TIGR04211 family SH3 domain-containing protein [Arcobacter sp. LA11]
MMHKATLLLVLVYLISPANAATRYVSDDLFTYIHSGPGTKYKIVGSINSGERINVIKTNAGFTQIKDSKGRNGWINSKYISRQPGLKERLPKLETKLAELNSQLNTAKDEANKDKSSLEKNLDSYKNQVNELQNVNSKLNEELQEVQTLNRSLNAKLDTQKNDLLMRWFTYGGMVAGGGLLIGLILPSLIPSRRKKTRW